MSEVELKNLASTNDVRIEEIVEADPVIAKQAKENGNKFFGKQEYDNAIGCYTEAILRAPEEDKELKATCLANRAACHLMKQEHDAVVSDCTEAMELKENYINAIQRRGTAYENLDKLAEALDDYKAVLALDPDNAKARAGVQRVEPEVLKRQEKMKEEMLGKLKDFGNTILGKFGLSLDNFKATQDSNTGSYNISFGK